MQNIKAAIIGMGIGEKHFEAIDGYKGANVKIICEIDKKKIKLLSKKYPNIKITSNVEEIFLDQSINLVSISSYDETHYDYIIKAINSNKNIIVEKPMCLSEQQLKNIYKKLKQNKKIKITSNLVLRVNDFFINVRKNLNTNKVFYIEADYIWGRKHKLSGWRSKTPGYSITSGAGIHMFDLIMWMLNLRPKYIQAFGSKKDNEDIKFKNNTLGLYILTFPKNILVKVTVNTTGAFKHFHEIKIFQKNKTFINNISEKFIFEYKNKTTKKKKILSRYPDKENRKKLIRNFLDHLHSIKIKPIVSLKEQIDLMSVCFAGDKSIISGKKITINYLK